MVLLLLNVLIVTVSSISIPRSGVLIFSWVVIACIIVTTAVASIITVFLAATPICLLVSYVFKLFLRIMCKVLLLMVQLVLILITVHIAHLLCIIHLRVALMIITCSLLLILFHKLSQYFTLIKFFRLERVVSLFFSSF